MFNALMDVFTTPALLTLTMVTSDCTYDCSVSRRNLTTCCLISRYVHVSKKEERVHMYCAYDACMNRVSKEVKV